ncbi:hypothetical protein EV361DRAFT_236317 [Lentinula raphanica]|nr:hypothetical protein F5880DRAFT_715737 [Lentinula raphanica]KAJ3976732.1 hypothetical protein EV361DRAFT_236317 [Lentinula raphanica]
MLVSNRASLFLYFFMFFVLLESVISPKVPKSKPLPPNGPYVPPVPQVQPPRKQHPIDRVGNPGLDEELFRRLKLGGLTLVIRLRRRKEGADLVTHKTNWKLQISPTEHWTLYLGESFAYDCKLPTRFAIAPPSTSQGDPGIRVWNPTGLGKIVFSSKQQKVMMFKELHDNLEILMWLWFRLHYTM